MNARHPLLLSTAACVAVLGCGKAIRGDAPTIAIFTPEAGSIVRHYVAVTGEATGALDRVEVQVDAAPPERAQGRSSWSLTLDVTSLDDGSHTVTATAFDRKGRTATTLPVSFVSAAHAANGSRILGGLVTGSQNDPVPGATVGIDGGPQTVSDATGHYAVTGVAPGAAVILHARATGYVDTYNFRVGGNGDVLDLNLPLFAPNALDYIASQYGAMWLSTAGTVLGLVLDTNGAGLAGTTVAVSPSASEGPFYVGTNGSFDPGLTATTRAGIFLAFGVPPGGPVDFVASNGTASFVTADSVSAPGAVSIVIGERVPGT